MNNYSRIQNKIWNSLTFNRLSEDAKLLWFYILTCPHGNMLGIFVLKPGYACADLGWDLKRFSKGLRELLTVPLSNGSGKGLIIYDEETSLLFIKNYLEHNPLSNPNQVKAALKKIQDLPNSFIFKDFETVLKRLGKPLYKPLLEGLPKPVTVTVTVTESVTESVTDRDITPNGDNISSSEPTGSDKGRSAPAKKKKQKQYSVDSQEYQLAKLLLDSIREHRANFKKPNLQLWAKNIDRMIRIDGRDPDEIREVIVWSQKDPFWQANILSTSKLREKFDQLAIKMQKNNGNNLYANKDPTKDEYLFSEAARKTLIAGKQWLEEAGHDS